MESNYSWTPFSISNFVWGSRILRSKLVGELTISAWISGWIFNSRRHGPRALPSLTKGLGSVFLILLRSETVDSAGIPCTFRWFILEFSTKKYVLFTEYFMSSFQITWYFRRTLWPRLEYEKQPCIWVTFYHRVLVYSYSTANVELFHTLDPDRQQELFISLAYGAGLPVSAFLNRFV